MANALLIAFTAFGATNLLFYDPLKTPWALWHRRETPLVPYPYLPTFLVILALFEGGWFLLSSLPSVTWWS